MLRSFLSRDNSENRHSRPTVYILIPRPSPNKFAVSWGITILMPEDQDYLFDIVPNQKPPQGFHIRETRTRKATVQSTNFEASIRVGSVPNNTLVPEHAHGHVVNVIKSHKIDFEKPRGMSVIWVTDVVDILKRTGCLQVEKGAAQKIEEQVRRLERQFSAAKATRDQ